MQRSEPRFQKAGPVFFRLLLLFASAYVKLCYNKKNAAFFGNYKGSLLSMRKYLKYWKFLIALPPVFILIGVAAFILLSPPKLNVETTLQGSYIASEMNIRGWALNLRGDREIHFYLDGSLIGIVPVNLARPDVYRAYTRYHNRKSGFSAKIPVDTEKLKEGVHQFKIVSVGAHGGTASRTFSMKYRRAVTGIDSPAPGLTCYENFTLTGWAFDDCGLRQVNVYADGKLLGQAETGLEQAAIERIYRGFPEGKYGGFSYAVNLNALSSGSHQIVVENIANDGNIQRQQVSIVKATVRMAIDTPPAADTLFTDSVNLTGWALGVNGVKEVDLLFDNKKVCSVKTGAPRLDISRQYPDYKDNNSGFSFNVSHLYPVRSGEHTMSVRAVGYDGYSAQEDFRIKKLKPAATIDKVTADPNDPHDVDVSGWALNAGGLKSVRIYLDSVTGDGFPARTGLPRPDLAQRTGYLSPDKSGFTCVVPAGSLAGHQFILQAVGNDGEPATVSGGYYRRYPASVNQMAFAECSSGTLLSGRRVPSSMENLLENYLNPACILSDNTKKYEFARLTASGPDDFDGVTSDMIDSLYDRFGAGGYLDGKGDVFLNAAKEYGINPIYLASHAAEESGWGRSAITTVYNKTTYYNFFGIGAYDNSAAASGSALAVKEGWDSVDRAIYGGAAWIARHYFHYAECQDTLYEMKWNACDLSHQYAMDTDWADNISQIMAKFYDLCPRVKVVYEDPLYSSK